MASQIIPDPTPKASQRPAAAAQPTPVRPSAPAPKAPPKPAPVPPAARQPAQDQDEDQPALPLSRGFLTQVPAWAVSMVVHIIALLVMALIAGDAAPTEKPVSIVSSASEEEEELVDIEEPDSPEETPEEVTEPVTDVAVTTDVVVPQVDVSPIPDNSEAAPASFDLVEIGDQSATVTEIGPVRGVGGAGVGGGFGGRKSSGALAKKGGGGKDTEDAVDRALKWIAAHQMPDGGWHFDLQKCPSCAGQCSHSGEMEDRCGATSMALLPFLGRGYTHREGPYKKQVEAGIGFLVKMALDGRGKAYNKGGNLYSQGLAGIALSECYAMSQDGRLAAPTQYVLDFIMAAQDPVGGGWRYSPKQPGDTSAVGWQIMALKSGNMAYLSVNPLTIKKAVEFLDSVQGDEYGGTYGYTGPGQRAGTSAVGLLCRMYLGWKKDHQGIQEGAAIIAKRGPTNDLYYNYYATQIMHHMEGDMWIAWNAKMKDLLLKNQATKGHEVGSWHEGVNGGHGAHKAGRLYCTALSTMILEVYYRHLPIYQNQSVQEEFKE